MKTVETKVKCPQNLDKYFERMYKGFHGFKFLQIDGVGVNEISTKVGHTDNAAFCNACPVPQ